MAHALLAHQTGFRHRKWGQSERELRSAEALDPSDADVQNAIGLHYRVLGQFDSAAAAMGRAHALEPLARHFAFQKGLVLLCAGKYQQSLEALAQALLVSTAYTAAHTSAAAARAGLGRFDEALAEQHAALISQGDTALARLAAGHHGEAGYTEFMQTIAKVRLQRMQAASRERFVPPAAMADAYAAAGDYERALRWLDRAEKERDVFITKVGCNRDYDPIRRDPRFQRIMQRVGLPADPRSKRDMSEDN
jgi:tetratricopeptide (TPR) repeat protein